MLPINKIKERLPEDYVKNLYEMFSPLVVDKILRGIEGNRLTTLRVNTIKYNIQDLMRYLKKINIKFERVLWYKEALIIKNANEKDLQKLDIFKNGFIYIQSLSSMIPPLVLNPQKGDKILDLTAAPGSKTTQIATLMNNEGYILANEVDKIRCEKLKYNVQNQNAYIVEVICGRGEKIGNIYEGKFDKVLLDAPCSGEGRFSMTNVQTYKTWSKKKVNEITKVQKKLFKSAINSLKKGGILVYSTCTINKEENEEIVNWALENFNIRLEKIDLQIREAMSGFNKEFDQSLNKTIRILPSKDMEGFFVSKFIKM